jgi:hypothetical protein
MKVVSPFRPFPPESQAHQKLGPFDWVRALKMLRKSVRVSCRCETWALTDVDTDLPVPAHAFVTTRRRLMLWLLEVCGCYLASPAFDQDTVMISPDMLVVSDISGWFTGADLGLMARLGPKHARRPILNGIQFWSLAGRDRLIAFYRQALACAEALPDSLIAWGADTEPLIRLLSPLSPGISERNGMRVAMHDAKALTPVVWDFKYLRKQRMADVFRHRFGSLA